MKKKKVAIDKIKVCLLFICFFICFIGGMLVNKVPFMAKAENFEKNVVLENWQYLSDLERQYREENPNITATEMVSYLDGKILELKQAKEEGIALSNDDSTVGDSSYNIFGEKVTAAEIALVALYPAEAILVFNAANEAKVTVKKFYEEGFGLGNADAFRHAYWNALMERRISKDYLVNIGDPDLPIYTTIQLDFAKMFADAHEDGKTGIDPEMDLRNNELGRTDSLTYSNLNETELALKIVERVSLGKYWRIINYEKVDDTIIGGELVPTDWTGLALKYFEQIMFDVLPVGEDAIILSEVKWVIEGTYEIPNSLNGKTLVGIGSNAFANQTQLTSVTLPNNVTSIGVGAFSGCTGLTSINIPDGVTTIGANAFAGCTSLTSITIPASVTNIGQGAFSGCSNLNITVDENSESYCVQDNILYNKQQTSIIASGNINTNINIPQTVTSIQAYAFSDNDNLEEVHIYGMPNFGANVFANCENLEEVYIYSFEESMLSSTAFTGDTLTLYVPFIEQYQYSSAFTGCNIDVESIDITVTLKLDANDNEPEIINTKYGAEISNELDPFKVGYTFNHWVDDSGKVYSHGDVWDSTESLTVTAVWTARQSYINFVGYGTEGIFDKLCTYDQPIGEMPVPNVEGQTFVAWRDDNGFYYYADTVWNRTNNLTLKAVFEGLAENPVVLYYIDFDQCGGQGGTDNLRQEYLMPMFPATAPEREGYDFAGYYTQPNGGGVQYYDAGMNSVRDWDIPVDTTLYAYWTPKEYTITIDLGYDGKTSEISAHYGDVITFDSIPSRTHYEFIGYYSQPDGNGDCYAKTEKKEPYEYPYIELRNHNKTWDYTFDGIIYAHWELLEMDYSIAVQVMGVGYLDPRVEHLVSGEAKTLNANVPSGYTFYNWNINGESFTTETVTYTFTLQRSFYTGAFTILNNFNPGAGADGGITLFLQQNAAPPTEDSCVAAGTLITLADGRQVPVETLTGNEMLLVWNLHTGSFDVAPILFIDSDALANYKIINLYFSDGTHVKVIDEHAFWDFNLNKYVYLREDASQYIGHWFNKQITDANGNMAWTRVQLTNVTITEEMTTAWSPVTYGHLCLYVNGMLSMPGGIEGLVNTFAVDGNTMRINQAQYLADITTYGLFTYEEFAEICPVPENIFNAVQGQYLKVAIGKGYIDYETLGGLIERYAEFF